MKSLALPHRGFEGSVPFHVATCEAQEIFVQHPAFRDTISDKTNAFWPHRLLLNMSFVVLIREAFLFWNFTLEAPFMVTSFLPFL